MKWTLIEESGSVERSWNYARHYLEDNQNIDDVLKMSLPVNSFKIYEFQIDSSIMLRDLIFTFRPLVAAWARSLRVDNYTPENIFIDPDECKFIKDNVIVDTLLLKVNDCINRVTNGEKKDYVKEDLPLLTETHYSIKIDFRSLMNLLYTFECHNKDYFNIIKSQVLQSINVSDELYSSIKKSDMYEKMALSEDELNYINSIDGYMPDSSNNKLLNIYLVGGKPSANIMAQFIRQHSSTIKNGLWNMFNDKPQDIMASDCKAIIPVLGYLDKTAYKNLITTRTCWFAQYDKVGSTSWDSIIGYNVYNMTDNEFINHLPCAGKCTKCKIKNEMIPRCDGRDQNIPCPIFTENPYMINNRINEFNSNSRIMKKWESVSTSGLIKLNINNEYNEMYMNRS